MLNRERRELFGSLKSIFSPIEETKKGSVIRPPYFSERDDFAKLCTACGGKCVTACQEHIIELMDDGSPRINFYKGGCTYCDDCLKVCEEEVLHNGHKREIDAKFEIARERCLSWNSTMCYSCKDACPEGAMELNGMFRVELNQDVCTSCGFCIKPCPVDAINF